MKKFNRSALTIAAILGMSMSLTSCDEDTITTILNVVSQLMGGQAQTFSGTAHTSQLTRPNVKSGWSWADKDSLTSSKTQTSMACQVSFSTETDAETNTSYKSVSITIPTLTYGSNSFTNLVIYGGPFTTVNNSTGTFNTSGGAYYYTTDNYTNGSNSLSITEQTENYWAVIYDGKITSDAITFSYSIIAGTEAYNGTYVGSLIK